MINLAQNAPKSPFLPPKFAPKVEIGVFPPPPPKILLQSLEPPPNSTPRPQNFPPPPLKKAPKRTELPQICPISLELQHPQNPPKKPPIAPKFGTSKIRPPYNSNPPPGFLHAAPKSEDFDPKFTPPPPSLPPSCGGSGRGGAGGGAMGDVGVAKGVVWFIVGVV